MKSSAFRKTIEVNLFLLSFRAFSFGTVLACICDAITTVIGVEWDEKVKFRDPSMTGDRSAMPQPNVFHSDQFVHIPSASRVLKSAKRRRSNWTWRTVDSSKEHLGAIITRWKTARRVTVKSSFKLMSSVPPNKKKTFFRHPENSRTERHERMKLSKTDETRSALMFWIRPLGFVQMIFYYSNENDCFYKNSYKLWTTWDHLLPYSAGFWKCIVKSLFSSFSFLRKDYIDGDWFVFVLNVHLRDPFALLYYGIIWIYSIK